MYAPSHNFLEVYQERLVKDSPQIYKDNPYGLTCFF